MLITKTSIMYLQATGAKVAQKNTPETDKLPEVNHIVNFTLPDGTCDTITIMAKDPMDAINKVNRMTVNDLKIK